jgi:hypothetical protein
MVGAAARSETVEIRPRDVRFHTAIGPQRWWLGGDAAATATLTALSATFPEGERMFIEAVSAYRDQVPEPLRTQVAAFLRQESTHVREHAALNAVMAEAGYDLSGIDARTRKRAEFSRTRPPLIRLSATAALEHFTAVMGRQLLTNYMLIDSAPDEIRRLWRWHSIEEIEHKAVAFDTLMFAARHLSPFRRWLLRVTVMAVITMKFTRDMGVNVADLLGQDGLDAKTARRLHVRHIFAQPGAQRRLARFYFAYYRPGFHPWDHDDRAIVEEALAEDPELAALGGASAPA